MAKTDWDSRIPSIAAQLDERVDAALRLGAESIEQDAKGRAPINTGRLRDAIHTERTGEGEYTVIAGDDGVFYGHLVELGTTRTPAHPFLIPALEARRSTVLASVNAALKGLVE